MFVIPTQKVGFTHRVVAMLAAFAIVLWSVGVYGVAQAANLADVSDLLSDSAPSATPKHTISFTTPTALSNASVTITFPTGFGTSSLASADVTPSEGTATVSNGVITVTGVTTAINDTVSVEVVAGKLVNPSATGSYEIIITAGADTGKTRVAIVDAVVVKAEVDTIFNFEVKGLASSTSLNGGSATTTTGSSTATELDFGTVVPGQVYVLGQELTVETNAINGFVVTVKKDGDLRSANGADINTFIDGFNTATETAWTVPTKDIASSTTWGHWGMTSDDSDIALAGLGGGDKWVAVQNGSVEVFSHDGPADKLTQDKGLARVAYGLQITSFQEAADDYTTTLTYIATPTF